MVCAIASNSASAPAKTLIFAMNVATGVSRVVWYMSDFFEAEVQFQSAKHDAGLMEECVARRIFETFNALKDIAPGAHLLKARKAGARAYPGPLGKRQVSCARLAIESECLGVFPLVWVYIGRSPAQVQI